MTTHHVAKALKSNTLPWSITKYFPGSSLKASSDSEVMRAQIQTVFCYLLAYKSKYHNSNILRLNIICTLSFVHIWTEILCWEIIRYCSMFHVPNISSSRPWTKAPQAPEAIRLTVFVSSFSLGASSAHFLPEENSPEVKSSLARSWAVRFLWMQESGGGKGS